MKTIILYQLKAYIVALNYLLTLKVYTMAVSSPTISKVLYEENIVFWSEGTLGYHSTLCFQSGYI